jgi:hypothetical protein
MPSRSAHDVFPPDFIVALRGLVGIHQSLYATTPPQGIYFESLVEQAFRRIKKPWMEGAIHYQLVDIPVLTLRMIEKIVVEPVGRRSGRQSLAADVMRGEQRIFRVHFDASDGKCSVRNLGIEHCVVLGEWDVRL